MSNSYFIFFLLAISTVFSRISNNRETIKIINISINPMWYPSAITPKIIVDNRLPNRIELFDEIKCNNIFICRKYILFKYFLLFQDNLSENLLVLLRM